MAIQQLFHTQGTLQKSGTGSSFSSIPPIQSGTSMRGEWNFSPLTGISTRQTAVSFICALSFPGPCFSAWTLRPDRLTLVVLLPCSREAPCIVLKKYLLAALDEPELFQECCLLTDKWLTTLVQGVGKQSHPSDQFFLTPGKEESIDKDKRISGYSTMLWLQIMDGKTAFLDIYPIAASSRPFPLPSGAWLQTLTGCRFHPLKTAELFRTPLFAPALENFHAVLLHCCMLERASILRSEATRLNEKQKRDAYSMRETLNEFVSILEPDTVSVQEEDPDDLLFSACLRIGKAQDISFISPALLTPEMDQLTEICKISRVRKRTITFKRNWQNQENGPILGFLAEEQRPVALLPAGRRGYQVFDPLTKKTSPLTQDFTQKLLPDGMVFYRPFTANILHLANILKFSVLGSRKDLFTVITMSILAALLGLIPPWHRHRFLIR